MAEFSNYLENAFINAALRATNFTAPTTVYVSLYTSDPTDADSGTEVSGGSYARTSAAFDAPSNLFLATCPDLLLYGALAEAEPYLMNDERLATWASLYDRGLASLRASDDDSEYPSSPMSITLSTR